MLVPTRSQVRLGSLQIVKPSPGLALPKWGSSSSSELPQLPSLEGSANCSDSAFEGYLSSLTVGNERSPAVHTCRAHCLTCPALIQENQFVFNTTSRKYFAIDIKTHEVHSKLQNYIYLLTCIHCGIQYVDQSITLLNLMKIHR